MACIRKRRNRWVVDFRDQGGVRRWESYRTRNEATAALESRLGQVRRDTYVAPADMPTVAAVAEAWLAGKADRRESTRATWRAHLRWIVDRIGAYRIDRLSVPTIEAELREPLRAALAPRTANAVLTTLTAVCEYGERCGYIERNPAALVERVRAGSGTGAAAAAAADALDETPTPDEVRRLLAAADGLRERTALTTLAVTGMRSGELLALAWTDVDMDRGRAEIRRGATWAGGDGVRYHAPKTSGSRRTVELPAELVSLLRRWKLACPVSADGLVFPKENGTAMHRATFRDVVLRPVQERAGLRAFGAHALRHFFASELIRRGYPPTEVAARLGHSSPAVTMAVYARWYRAAKSDAVVELARAICGAD